MSLAILQSLTEVDQARAELERRNLSCLQARRGWLRSLLRPRTIEVGDRLKSWDVLRTVRFLEANIARDDAVLDIGAYASEILCILKKLGYTRLSGVDFNRDLVRMPYAESIRYEVADFMHTRFPDESFAAVTAISVIEHGFNSEALLNEVTRLLRPGGYFIASFDYWREKIDTSTTPIFGLDWRIFSRAEVDEFIASAA